MENFKTENQEIKQHYTLYIAFLCKFIIITVCHSNSGFWQELISTAKHS